jgi:cyclopropane-fatty-acyl-phospholipid synthase
MLDYLLDRYIRHGSLTVIFPGGRTRTFGEGEPHAQVHLHDWGAVRELGWNPDLKLGELYMDGRLTVEEGNIAAVLEVLMMNVSHGGPRGWHRLRRRLRRLVRAFSQFNPASRSKAHVAHHYDLSGRLYDLFLDRDRQYSCAYFTDATPTLEAAQAAKKQHITAKLKLNEPDLAVLDIGCGWGGLALDLARGGAARVQGITLSEEQLAVARMRSAQAGLSERCKFDLIDYRSLKGKFDRIVSVGMFEHVGAPYYQRYFEKVHELLADKGVMLLHTIGRTDGPGATNSWIAKYIFPGGYVPALSEIVPVIERCGLMITDVEVLRLHYAATLKEWRKRFVANWAKVAQIYDERFCRMWEFYLAGSEMAFRHDDHVVFQIQIAKRVDTLPITRDYMLESPESTARPHLRLA